MNLPQLLYLIIGGFSMFYTVAHFSVVNANIPKKEALLPQTDDEALWKSIRHNLRVIEIAKEQWALQNYRMGPDSVSITDITQYLPNNMGPRSVMGETYNLESLEKLAEGAFSDQSMTLKGQRGPFTVTSF